MEFWLGLGLLQGKSHKTVEVQPEPQRASVKKIDISISREPRPRDGRVVILPKHTLHIHTVEFGDDYKD